MKVKITLDKQDVQQGICKRCGRVTVLAKCPSDWCGTEWVRCVNPECERIEKEACDAKVEDDLKAFEAHITKTAKKGVEESMK